MKDSAAEERAVCRLADELRGHIDLRVVGECASERLAFFNFELASLVETHLGKQLNPESFDESARTYWSRKFQTDLSYNRSQPQNMWFWLMAREGWVGILCCSSRLGHGRISVDSLYVLPEYRGSGHGKRVLLAVRDAAWLADFKEVRLETGWTFPRAPSFYMHQKMWVIGWKDALLLAFRRDLPQWGTAFSGDTATFSAGEGAPLITVQRHVDRLLWEEPEGDREAHVRWRARSTFALVLALAGWPLIRSDELWQEQLDLGFSDVGGPEGLAFKVRVFEAWAREQGWQVAGPRIPGLDYPSHAELMGRK